MDTAPRPAAGQLLHITRAASVQFTRPFRFRVIRTLDQPTYYGWAWIDGYQLDDAGDAISRRELYVQLAGLRPAAEPTRPRNARAVTPKRGQANQRAPQPARAAGNAPFRRSAVGAETRSTSC